MGWGRGVGWRQIHCADFLVSFYLTYPCYHTPFLSGPGAATSTALVILVGAVIAVGMVVSEFKVIQVGGEPIMPNPIHPQSRWKPCEGACFQSHRSWTLRLSPLL